MLPITWNGPGFWLGAGCLMVSAACLIVGVRALMYPELKSSRLNGYVRIALLVLAVAFFAAGFMAWTEARTAPVERFLLQAALVGIGFCCHDLFGRLTQRSPRVASIALVAGGILLGGWLTIRWERGADPADPHAEVAAVTAEICKSLDVTPAILGLTDKGNPVPLFRMQMKKAPREDTLERAEALQRRLLPAGPAVLAGPIDLTHNCHGWIFTGGRFLLGSDDIDRILTDNGYLQVEQPAAGDLIIYRSEEGSVVHSGIVKATGADGFVLIESKWGLIGSHVLHAPELQEYSQHFAYYRSPRARHLLRGLNTEDVSRR